MKRISGVITVIQERRFQLVGDDGPARLFMLAHDAPVDSPDLHPLQREQAHVVVEYEDAPDMIAGIAHDVTLTGDAHAAGHRVNL